MNDQPNQEPFDEGHLNSEEYRERLTRKLNCLIALLEVAMARVRRSLAGPDPDIARLTKIRTNLQSTLEVCLRARTALERHEPLPEDLPASLSQVARQAAAPASGTLQRSAELSSLEEKLKFERLGRITSEEVARADLDDLERKLQGF